MYVTFFLCLLLIHVGHSYKNCDIIYQFSKSKLISKGIIFGCLKPKDAVLLSKCLMKYYLRFLIINTNKPFETLEKYLVQNGNHLGVVLDADCKNWDLIINENTNKKYFYETYHWLVISSSSNITYKLEKLKLNINSDMNMIVFDGINETSLIYDVYNPASEHGGEFKMEIFGYYNKNGGYVIENLENKYWRRRDLTGVLFKSAVVVPVLNMPLSDYLASDENRQIDSMHRFQANTVNHCKQMYNFRQVKIAKPQTDNGACHVIPQGSGPAAEVPKVKVESSVSLSTTNMGFRFLFVTFGYVEKQNLKNSGPSASSGGLADFNEKILEFGISLDIQRTNSWGYVQADGKFDGLVSLLERRIVDFGSSPLLFKLDRTPYVDYGYGNWILRSAFIYRKPKVSKSSHEIFLRPLEAEVWLLVSVTLGIFLMILKIIFSKEMQVVDKKYKSVDETTWSFLVLFTLGAFFQQGSACYPKFLSSRILAFFVFLFSILIYQFYSASIVSYLLMDPPRTIFDLKDLKESSLRVGIEDILIDRNYFVQTTDPDAIQLFESKIKNSNNNSGFYSPLEGLEFVRKGGFAFHVETSTAYPIIEETFSNQDICELEEIQMYKTQPMFANLQKNSPFREMMNYCMLKQAEDGNLDRLRKHWNARQPRCIERAKRQEIHVSFKEFLCGPLAVFLGAILALLLLLFEIILHRKQDIFNFVKSIWEKRNTIVLYPFIK